MMTRRTMLHAAGLAGAAALPRKAAAAPVMEVAVRSSRFIVNGVTTDRAGRIFLSMPRWTGMEDTPGLGRVTDGAIVPSPGAPGMMPPPHPRTGCWQSTPSMRSTTV